MQFSKTIGADGQLPKGYGKLGPAKITAQAPEPKSELQRLINTSSALDDKEKWCANYTIDALDEDILAKLLKDTTQDGVDTLFSREAWEARAALMMRPENSYVE
jgi:hypothetical protein